MITISRRSFVAASSLASAPTPGCAEPTSRKLDTIDTRTAIGLGDQHAGVLDVFGQLRTRNAEIRLDFGTEFQPGKTGSVQTLGSGWLPIVRTELKDGGSQFDWRAFTSDSGGVACDYIELLESSKPALITLLFPFVTELEASETGVTSGERLLAAFPRSRIKESWKARYNCMTPSVHSWAFGEDPWVQYTPLKLPAGVDPGFGSGRKIAAISKRIAYHFPAQPGKTYHVYVGLIAHSRFRFGNALMRIAVDGRTATVDPAALGYARPTVHHFPTTAGPDGILVSCAADPSSLSPYGPCWLNAIWVFEKDADPAAIIAGRLSATALYYVRCGREDLRESTSGVILEPPSSGSKNAWVRLPYDARTGDLPKVVSIASDTAEAAVKARWEGLLADAAEFTTGVPKLDNLYKTSVVNMFLLRTRYAGAGDNGDDIFAVKAGPTVYDNFWYRDAAYIVNAMNAAGMLAEAERSLRLFWQTGLKGTLAYWGQQENGVWHGPATEWDSQGQALWGLTSHYEFTRDRNWLRQIYPSIRKGVAWIENAVNSTRSLGWGGEKPVQYGLLPPGEGEAISGGDYQYYHNIWAALGLRQAIMAADSLEEKDDAQRIRRLYESFSACLLRSIQLAYKAPGGGKFIPATPFDPKPKVWGSLAALYPSRFLGPHDPMMTNTLAVIRNDSKEDLMTFEDDLLWTYITVDWAMCHLLRGEREQFHRLFDSYVAHASSTNNWVEAIRLPRRTGVGDMPHGWGAASFVLLLRNSLVMENEKRLDLCAGVHPTWLKSGVSVAARRATTKFGRVDLKLQRTGSELVLDFNLTPNGHPKPEEIRFHLAKTDSPVSSVRINGRSRSVVPGESRLVIG